MPRRPTKLERADLTVARHAGRWHDSRAMKLLGGLSEIADQPQLYAVCWGVIGFGLVTGRGRLARTGARMLAAEWIATKAKSAIKHRVDRTRPAVPAEGGRYRMERGDSDAKPLNSFPSGHTAGAFAVATAYASDYPVHRIAAYAAATAIAAIQIPRCTHYVSDIGAGAAIGLTAGGLVARRDR